MKLDQFLFHLFKQMFLTINGEIKPETLAGVQQGQFMLDKRNSSTLWQVHKLHQYIFTGFGNFRIISKMYIVASTSIWTFT